MKITPNATLAKIINLSQNNDEAAVMAYEIHHLRGLLCRIFNNNEDMRLALWGSDLPEEKDLLRYIDEVEKMSAPVGNKVKKD